MDMGRVRIDIDRDWVERDDETRTCDDVTDGLHGLATASVIMSGRSDPQHGVSGPACCAEILPLRVTKPGHPRPAPVLFWSGMRRLRDAVRYAVKSGCEVISMSLGGVPYRSLREAIQEANAHGVIVCAAAGNEVGFVVPPARYDETIAVAGSDINRCRWRGSCRGPQVDVTAPAESVWRATVKGEAPHGMPRVRHLVCRCTHGRHRRHVAVVSPRRARPTRACGDIGTVPMPCQENRLQAPQPACRIRRRNNRRRGSAARAHPEERLLPVMPGPRGGS